MGFIDIKYKKYIIYEIQNIFFYISYIYESIGRCARQQGTIRRAHGVVQGCLQRVGEARGLFASRLALLSEFAVWVRYLLYWVQLGSQGIGNVAEASGPSKPSSRTHQSCLLQIPLQKGLCQLRAAAGAWLALLGVVPCWFDCQASQARTLYLQPPEQKTPLSDLLGQS